MCEQAHCVWCDRGDVILDEDHIFPRALGGTKELWVPACRDCQTVLSKLEVEAARQSHYSLFCVTHGPGGRHKRKTGSGVIRARYLLVKHPLGGYGESALRAGAGLPESIPHIEIDVTTNRGARARGPTPECVDRLVLALLKIVDRKPDAQGLIGEIQVRTDELPEITADADFWPRVVLDLSGHTYIRARNSDEALRFAAALIPALKGGAFRDHSGWTNSEVAAGTSHQLLLKYDKLVVQRLAGKIACGLMILQSGTGVTTDISFRRVRDFVLANSVGRTASPVTQLCDAGTETPWKGNHVALICRQDSRILGIISMYGDCQLVDFGADSRILPPNETLVAMCRWDGTRAQILTEAIVPEVAAELKSRAVSFCLSPQRN